MSNRWNGERNMERAAINVHVTVSSVDQQGGQVVLQDGAFHPNPRIPPARRTPKPALEFMKLLKSKLCKNATIDFVFCHSDQLGPSLQQFFGPDVKIITHRLVDFSPFGVHEIGGLEDQLYSAQMQDWLNGLN